MTAKWYKCKADEVPILGVWSHTPQHTLEKSDGYLRVQPANTAFSLEEMVGVSLEDGVLRHCGNKDNWVWLYLGEE